MDEKKEEKNIDSLVDKNQIEQIENEQGGILSLEGAEVPNKIYRKQALCKNPGKWTDYIFSPQTRSLYQLNSKGFLVPEGVNIKELVG